MKTSDRTVVDPMFGAVLPTPPGLPPRMSYLYSDHGRPSTPVVLTRGGPAHPRTRRDFGRYVRSLALTAEESRASLGLMFELILGPAKD